MDPAIAEQDHGSDQHTIPGELVLMKAYLDKAMEAWVNPRNEKDAALNHIRKIAGLAVRCMEHHGAPPRMVPREITGLKELWWGAQMTADVAELREGRP